MKHLLRFLTLTLLVTAMALTPVLSAQAQGDDEILCQGLSDADCQIVLGASDAMAGVTSFSVPAWSIDAMLDTGDERVDFSASGTAAFAFTTDIDPTDPLAGQVLHLKIDQASVSGADMDDSGSAEIIITGNMLYVNWEGEWYGGELAEGDMDTGDVAELQGMLSGGVSPDDFGLDLSKAITTTRGADGDVMGQTAASFSTDVNVIELLLAVLQSPDVGALLSEGAGDDMAIQPEELALLGGLLVPLLKDSQIAVDQWIGLDDNYVHRLVIDAVLSLDATMFDSNAGVINGRLYFESDLADFNLPVEPPVPANYMPLDELGMELEGVGDAVGGVGDMGM